ncbi:EcoRVM [Schleiferilactobacillus shenzhenensis LY-73]|uniref:Site-specific DNA-methyltransferase (adenine-specific) n=1 Tax=Schleiferilactobacillus shenzhenensis LY-73 TaxID=1231336 RepID=U4TV66_9LACO|nr:EcoRVM [Schleiferilactobacillus shenzhenensis LY-73]
MPREITKVHVPPIKIQGIKTKLVPFIAASLSWDGNGVWYEPFMGSGVVGFNIAPKRAIFSDNNPYIIQFYQDLQRGDLDAAVVRDFLTAEGAKLCQTPADARSYYYRVRERFNQSHSSLDFLFLQRSNFNGMIRFGPNGYNVPFGRKPARFSPALITKIVHQVAWAQQQIQSHDWQFRVADWQDVLATVSDRDFVYLDPPYAGRSTDYFGSWTAEDTEALANWTNTRIPGGYALSMWYKNKYRTNDALHQWHGELLTDEHYYFLGGKTVNRNAMTEALVVKKGYVAPAQRPVII